MVMDSPDRFRRKRQASKRASLSRKRDRARAQGRKERALRARTRCDAPLPPGSIPCRPTDPASSYFQNIRDLCRDRDELLTSDLPPAKLRQPFYYRTREGEIRIAWADLVVSTSPGKPKILILGFLEDRLPETLASTKDALQRRGYVVHHVDRGARQALLALLRVQTTLAPLNTCPASETYTSPGRLVVPHTDCEDHQTTTPPVSFALAGEPSSESAPLMSQRATESECQERSTKNANHPSSSGGGPVGTSCSSDVESTSGWCALSNHSAMSSVDFSAHSGHTGFFPCVAPRSSSNSASPYTGNTGSSKTGEVDVYDSSSNTGGIEFSSPLAAVGSVPS